MQRVSAFSIVRRSTRGAPSSKQIASFTAPPCHPARGALIESGKGSKTNFCQLLLLLRPSLPRGAMALFCLVWHCHDATKRSSESVQHRNGPLLAASKLKLCSLFSFGFLTAVANLQIWRQTLLSAAQFGSPNCAAVTNFEKAGQENCLLELGK